MTELPVGFRVELRTDVRRVDGGRVLLGGSPVRVVRMTPRAVALLSQGVLEVVDTATGRLARQLLDGNVADPVLPRQPVAASDITVVIPVRDRSAQLERCLEALRPLKAIVVDDASLDAAAIRTVADRFEAKYVRLDVNVGPAGARNVGLKQVTTQLVAFVDSDVTVTALALQMLARHCTDPRLALVGPAVRGSCGSERPRWFERYDVAASSLDLGSRGAQVRPGAAVGWLPSACLVGRTSLLGRGFDAHMRVGEDVDLVWRLHDRGQVVRYDPTVVARHDVRPTVRGWLGRKFVYGTGGGDLARRHGDRVAPAALSPVMAVGAFALLVRRKWSLPVAAMSVAVSARLLHRTLPLDRDQDRRAFAFRLSLRGLGWAVQQESALILRHWWPGTLLALLVSRSVRRAFVAALLVDIALFMRERPGVGAVTVLAARRADDLAYGAGLWWGALRAGSARCLMVRRPGS
ncbi:mycofactocin biosynthesis glycosyltransferase MftF [Nocardioides cavernae]|uniref:Mycofactocin biosynthesis glycosyltransferase MftF n=1 Tax=Nocardioides cavernae TaxID=1921566 RepID=A0ABR8N9D5_9ACTN|nr:mycofactocin biosynthesis glycosyltransferase MftF [Nocardioides cavernae]MBD3924202.1 mycofactocin biosynthesis glycosyltransferase MftF [Nocardioides cavernae]MBM7510860.1 mycofactocin system glycosyltransferase [Nocardioides cavernae]